MAMLFLLVALLLFCLMGVPLAFAIGGSSVTYLFTNAPQFLSMIPQRVWNGAFSDLMIAMPLFILAGELMNIGGITQRIIDFCLYVVRPFRGGLGEVTVVASMIFGGISGSSVADTSALGSILIPAMEKKGYPPKVAAGITVASSTVGMIIPPSVPMIVFSMVSGASVGALFLAGAVPGILIGLTQLIVVYMISRKRGYHPARTPFDAKDFIHTVVVGLPAILMPIVIIVCIAGGVCTATESAGIAVLYALLLGFFFYRELSVKAVIESLRKTLVSSASIMIIIGFSTIFTWIMTIEQVPDQVAALFTQVNMPVWGIALLFDVIILLTGFFIDVTPAILLLCPILLPIIRATGIGDLQFGAMVIVGLAIGLVTPPVGMCLNACNKINGMSVVKIFQGALPYLTCNVLILLCVSLIPSVTTWLPAVLGMMT